MAKGKLFMGLPGWSKGVISVLIAGGAAFAVYKIYQAVQKAKELETATQENQATADEAKKLINKGIKPSMNGTQLISTVNGIKEAWLTYDQITRPHYQEFIHELVKVKNDLDMLNLIKIYGNQEINFPWSKFTVSNFTGNLTQAVKHFLNTKELTAANNLLAGKGIKYRF